MRVDAFLKKNRVVKQRGVAKTFCDRGYVRVNGAVAKPSHMLKVGDLIELETGKGVRRYRVAAIPGEAVRRGETAGCAEPLP